MDLNQKYCQSCHLISRNSFIITKIVLMHGQCYLNAAAASREYAERFPERHHPGSRQFLI
jgi:hypothetical protein